MNYLKRLYINLTIRIKLAWYNLLDSIDGGVSLDLDVNSQLERSNKNAKLSRGVKKLVAKLRNMTVEERLSTENLLGSTSYKKTRTEKLQELKVKNKVLKNPILKTEDDLVHRVVREAPRYVLEQELGEVRKARTACLKAAGINPNDPKHTDEMKALTAKYKALKGQIQRMKSES